MAWFKSIRMTVRWLIRCSQIFEFNKLAHESEKLAYRNCTRPKLVVNLHCIGCAAGFEYQKGGNQSVYLIRRGHLLSIRGICCILFNPSWFGIQSINWSSPKNKNKELYTSKSKKEKYITIENYTSQIHSFACLKLSIVFIVLYCFSLVFLSYDVIFHVTFN